MPEFSKQAERRIQPRYALHLTGSAETLYRRNLDVATGEVKSGASSRFKIETVNISTGGVMITFDMEISPSDVLKMYFSHPETRTELAIEAQIQWMRKNASNLMGRYCAGVSFKRDPDEVLFDEVVLRRLIKKAERLCSGVRHAIAAFCRAFRIRSLRTISGPIFFWDPPRRLPAYAFAGVFK